MYLDRQLIAGAVELLMRRVRGLGSWSALERESGVSRSTLYRLKDADPRVETSTFARIEHALQLPPDTLVTIGVHDTEGLAELGVEPWLSSWVGKEIARKGQGDSRTSAGTA